MNTFRPLHCIVLVLATAFFLLLSAAQQARSQDGNSGFSDTDTVETNEAANTDSGADSNATLRAYLQLQQQIHEAQLAIERTRAESEQAAAKNAEALTTRLQAVERSLNDQHKAEFDAMQSTIHFMLVGLGVFAAAGFLAVVLTAYFQWRTVGRLADLSHSMPVPHALNPPGGVHALESMTAHPELTNERLAGVIERLEKRILELEHTASSPLKSHSDTSNGAPVTTLSSPNVIVEAESSSSNGSNAAAKINQLLDRGQKLLNIENAEEALACFDEALELEAAHADALVKKGVALEKLRRPQEAIECYDQAIAANPGMTIAYLHKGGLFNRMERYNEAIECYEQALRTQEKQRAA